MEPKKLFVDYTRIGYATRFRTSVFKADRDGLEPGTTVIVTGDSVPDRRARVVEVTPTTRAAVVRLPNYETPRASETAGVPTKEPC